MKTCRNELYLLKQLWDLIELIRRRIEEWRKSSWKEINIDNIDQELRQTFLNRELRALSKESNQWDAYCGIEREVKNLVIALRSVGEFRNEAIRKRHWDELMNETGVQIEIDDQTTLGDLLSLNLHKFEEQVRRKFIFPLFNETREQQDVISIKDTNKRAVSSCG